jgi:hypothetical protein
MYLSTDTLHDRKMEKKMKQIGLTRNKSIRELMAIFLIRFYRKRLE